MTFQRGLLAKGNQHDPPRPCLPPPEVGAATGRRLFPDSRRLFWGDAMTPPPDLITAEREAHARYLRARNTQHEARAHRQWVKAKAALIAWKG
jgi:hypothetical protein